MTSVDKIAEEVQEICTKYANNVNVRVKQVIADEAEAVRQDVMARAKDNFTSHDRSNPYYRSWRIKKRAETASSVVYTLHSKKYRLAHLLENGHILVVHGKATGKRVEGRPHIAPAAKAMESRLGKKIETEIKKAAND